VLFLVVLWGTFWVREEGGRWACKGGQLCVVGFCRGIVVLLGGFRRVGQGLVGGVDFSWCLGDAGFWGVVWGDILFMLLLYLCPFLGVFGV